MPELDFRAPRLFVDAPLRPGEKIALERNQSNYLGNVLRLSAGEQILVFNGRDGEWQAQIAGRKPQHIAEIIALVALQRDRLARAQGGIDEQARGTKIEFRHLVCSVSRRF